MYTNRYEQRRPCTGRIRPYTVEAAACRVRKRSAGREEPVRGGRKDFFYGEAGAVEMFPRPFGVCPICGE